MIVLWFMATILLSKKYSIMSNANVVLEAEGK